MNTFKMPIVGERNTRLVVDGLVKASQWFQVEPRPDGVWEVVVKEENKNLLIKIDTTKE